MGKGLILFLISTSIFAVENKLLQKFDNQLSFGYGITQRNFSILSSRPNSRSSNASTQPNFINFEFEKLFDNGIWWDSNAQIQFSTGNIDYLANSGNFFTNQNLQLNINTGFGLDSRLGYAFPLIDQHLQLIPYIAAGISYTAGFGTLIWPSSIVNLNTGIGGRVEYRVNDIILLYADQMAFYEWNDNEVTIQFTHPLTSIFTQTQNSIVFTSTLGAKFNVYKKLQLGIKGFYSNYQLQSINSSVSPQFAIISKVQDSFGGLLSVGLTY